MQRDAMTERLAAGDALILFPEGTSGDGNRVLPFKSALFSAAEQMQPIVPIAVQPVSIAYTRLDGMPLGRLLRPFFAWYGDADWRRICGSCWGSARSRWWSSSIRRHSSPIAASRKALARYCYASGRRRGMAAAAGRPAAADAAAAPAPRRRSPAAAAARNDRAEFAAERVQAVTKQRLHQDLWLPDERL